MVPLTCPKVDYNIYQEDGVTEAIERDPSSAQIIVEK